MDLTRDEFRDITRAFLTEDLPLVDERIIKEQSIGPDPSVASRTESQYGPTQSGNPQSYSDLTQRLQQVVLSLEELSMDYVNSGWLADGDHASLERDVDNLWKNADTLTAEAENLASALGEM